MSAVAVCPDWCTRDHRAAEEQIRRFVQSVADMGYPDYPAAVLAEEIAASRRDHEHAFNSEGAVVAWVSSAGDEAPTASLPNHRCEDLNAREARLVAAALLDAADLLDEIDAQGGSR